MDGHADPEAAFHAAGAHEERFGPKPPQRGKQFGRLRVLTLADAASAPPRQYLLRGLVAPGELSVWWGAPKCGKSFLLLRLAYGLALGVGMWGRSATGSWRVLYVAAEGEGGFAARLLALSDAMGDAGDAFRYIAGRVTVGPPAEDLDDVISAAVDMRADLIVLDTLARTFGNGDENAAQGMGGFVTSVDRLREHTGAHVAIIHHGTKNGESSRGSGALLGAADLIVKVARGTGEGEPNDATVEAAKDDADGAVLPFRLRVVDLAPAEDGTERKTCIAEEAEGEGRRCATLPQAARTALRYLADLITVEGEALPAGPHYPMGVRGAPLERWRAECESRKLSGGKTEENRDRAFRGAVQKLRNAGRIAVRDKLVWMTRVGEGDA